MKAIITSTPLQLEGEPAEIAQLVELLSSGAVLVEHVHKWRIGELTDEATVKGACWCGQERDFNPQLPEGAYGKTAVPKGIRDHLEPRVEETNTVAVARGDDTRDPRRGNAFGKRPYCEACGRKHKIGNCTLRGT